ncbi:MAG: hypothetical protein ACFFF4_09925 [Candidatus Thorarchaeota archaeon]
MTIRPHTLRKRFRTQLAAAINADVVEVLLGHETSLTQAYRRYTIDELASFYLQGQYALSLSVDRQELEKVAGSAKKAESRVAELELKLEVMKKKLDLISGSQDIDELIKSIK